MGNDAVQITNLHKAFSTGSKKTAFVQFIQHVARGKSNQVGRFCALKNINVTALKGEKIGIVGNNGSGKSTLLKLIAGIYASDNGEIHAHGNVALLAGFGIGMLGKLSVKENVYLFGTIHGMDRNQIRDKFSDIIEWAGLEDFVETKLDNLSSGMKARLGFSTFRYIDADVILLDEALGAGDKDFKQKCKIHFEQKKTDYTTYLVASHNLEFISMFCSKTLWLQRSQQMAFGKTEEVIQSYRESKSG